MRRRLAVLVAVTSFLTVLLPASTFAGRPAPADVRTDWARVQLLLFDMPLRDFIGIAASPTAPDRRFDWTTDGCSAPLVGDTGISFNFRNPCRRHDFGYRNLRLLDRRYGSGFWTATNRRRVDEQFLTDMRAHCRTRAFWLQSGCTAWARMYFSAVRVFGGP